MRRYWRNIVMLLLISFANTLMADGISRSNGLGIKLSFWNITNHPTRISTSGYGENADVSIGGAGIWINYHSRLRTNLFAELKLGAIGGINATQQNYTFQTQEVSSVVPLTLGLRYDLFSKRLPTKIQPFLTTGVGIYGKSQVYTNTDPGGETEIKTDSDFGAYVGGGTYLVLTNWFALNFDLTYHFVDFEFEKGFSGMEFGVGSTFMWGSQPEIFQIKSIDVMVPHIYPAYYQFYSLFPIVMVTVENTAGYPIEINIKSNIRGYSERAHETGFTQIAKGKEERIPVHAIFGKKLLESSLRQPAVVDLSIQARSGVKHNKSMSVPVMVHSRNAWDGDTRKLSLFVTSDDQDILNKARALEKEVADSGSVSLKNFHIARHVFESLNATGMRYLNDPNIPYYSDDRVQFAKETISIKTGDCDDLVVLYASLLESLGIRTAFVDVHDPEESIAHLYLLFDTGISESQSGLISSNEKRYVIRGINGHKSVWIPVETTLIQDGFDKAWQNAAVSYLRQGVLRNGFSEGWVQIFDINEN